MATSSENSMGFSFGEANTENNKQTSDNIKSPVEGVRPTSSMDN